MIKIQDLTFADRHAHSKVREIEKVKVKTHFSQFFRIGCENIASGTTDPEIESVATWNSSKFYHHLAPCHLQVEMLPPLWFANIGHQVVPLAWVTILVTRWSYYHWLQIWPPGSRKRHISWKLGSKVAQLALVQNLVISLIGHEGQRAKAPVCNNP